ncbi:hypothetical protein ABH916_005176 [Peribacillus frigoritolerans]
MGRQHFSDGKCCFLIEAGKIVTLKVKDQKKKLSFIVLIEW